jgi:hypothetical protein
MVTAMKRAVVMAMRVVGEDEGDGEGGKRDGDGVKRAIARKKAMASNGNNKMMVTEAVTKHCCRHHRCPCLNCCCSSLCFWCIGRGWQRLVAEDEDKGGCSGGAGGEFCVEF